MNLWIFHLQPRRRNDLFAHGTQLIEELDDRRQMARTGYWSSDAQADHGPSLRSTRGLDWFVFFLADVQTGFGPFVAVYLTTQKWTQIEIGLILSVGGLIALLGQIPGGALVDWARSERLVAGLAVSMIGVSALAYAAWPIFSDCSVSCGAPGSQQLCIGTGDCRHQSGSCRPIGHQPAVGS